MQKNLFRARHLAPGRRSVRDQLDALLRETVSLSLTLAQGATPEQAQRAGALATKAIGMIEVAPRLGRVPQTNRDVVFDLQKTFGAVAWAGSEHADRFVALCKAVGLLALEWSKNLRGRRRWIRVTTLQEQKGKCAGVNGASCTNDARDVVAVPGDGAEVYKGFCRSCRLKYDARGRCARAVSTRIDRANDTAGQLRLGL